MLGKCKHGRCEPSRALQTWFPKVLWRHEKVMAQENAQVDARLDCCRQLCGQFMHVVIAQPHNCMLSSPSDLSLEIILLDSPAATKHSQVPGLE